MKFRKLIDDKQRWAEDLPFMAPNGRCYFDHSKECTPECENHAYAHRGDANLVRAKSEQKPR